MTFHMEQTQLKQRINYENNGSNLNSKCKEKNTTETDFNESCDLSRMDIRTSSPLGLQKFEKRIPFPQRLWDAINDTDTMITWTADGRGVLVDEIRFQKEVMSLYPGFVQVSNFNNLRRQLRVYNFEWQLVDDHTDNIVFCHPCFQRGHPELLPYVFTRRRIIKPTKRRHDETCTDDDQPEGAPQEDSPGTSAQGVSVQSRHRRRYKRRKPLTTGNNYRMPDSKELDSNCSHDAASTADRTIGQSHENPQNHSVTRMSKNPIEKLYEETLGGNTTSASCGRHGENSAEFERNVNPLDRPCEEDVLEGGMKNHKCECMFSNKLGEGDCAGGGAPTYLKNCSFKECCNHTCGHCNARWASKSFINQPSQRVPYYLFPSPLGGNNLAPQERYYPTTPYGYHFMAPMMPPISPKYVMDPNMINTPMNSPLNPQHTMKPADQAVSNTADTNQKAFNTKTMSSPQSPVHECSNPPKTYHRLETVPDAMSWHRGIMYNEAYHNYVTSQKMCRYEKPVANWCWNIAPESHSYQIPHNPSPNTPHSLAKTCVTAKIVGSPKTSGTIKSQNPRYIPQVMQVKSTMPMQCGQQDRGNVYQSKKRDGVLSIQTRNNLQPFSDQGKEGVKLHGESCEEMCSIKGESQAPKDQEGVTPAVVVYSDEKQIGPSMIVHNPQRGKSNDRYEDNKCTEISKDKGNHSGLEDSDQVTCKKCETDSAMVDQLISFEETNTTVVHQIVSQEETEPAVVHHAASNDETMSAITDQIVSQVETEPAVLDHPASIDETESTIVDQIVSHDETETANFDPKVLHEETETSVVDQIVLYKETEPAAIHRMTSIDGAEILVVDQIVTYDQTETAVVDNIASYEEVGGDNYSAVGGGSEVMISD